MRDHADLNTALGVLGSDSVPSSGPIADHASDAPVFEWADEAVAVNPHDRLLVLAGKKGWAVEDWG